MRYVMAALALALSGTTATGQDKTHFEILTNGGIAFSSEDEKTKVVTAYDPVEAFEQHGVLVADCAKFFAEHHGVKWCFLNAANKDTFVKEAANPKGNKYVPFAGGRCAQGVSNGRLDAAGDPMTAVVIRFGTRPQDVALVLNGSMDVRTNFLGKAERGLSEARMYLNFSRERKTLIPNKPQN